MAQLVSDTSARACTEPDAAAFAAFYAHYQPRLHRYCAFRFGQDVAEEITSQAMERALRCFAELDLDRDPWAWLVVVARNAGLNCLRAGQQCTPVELETLEDLPALRWSDPAEAWELQEQSMLVSAALARIPPGQRLVLLLRLREELDFPSIAERLGTSENAVRQQLFKGRKAFAVAYRSLTGRLPALAPWAAMVGLVRSLLGDAHVRGVRTVRTVQTTAAVSAATVTLASLGLVLHLGAVEASPSKAVQHLDTRNAADTTSQRPTVTQGVRRAQPPVPPSSLRHTQATLPTGLAVVAKVASHPLVAGQAQFLSVRVGTPAGELHYSSATGSEQVGPICRAVTGICG